MRVHPIQISCTNRNRSDEDFITDLCEGFLLREPDQGGYDFWLYRLRDDNSQGLSGRERITRVFAAAYQPVANGAPALR